MPYAQFLPSQSEVKRSGSQTDIVGEIIDPGKDTEEREHGSGWKLSIARKTVGIQKGWSHV
jgi:hypothetical protein